MLALRGQRLVEDGTEYAAVQWGSEAMLVYLYIFVYIWQTTKRRCQAGG